MCAKGLRKDGSSKDSSPKMYKVKIYNTGSNAFIGTTINVEGHDLTGTTNISFQHRAGSLPLVQVDYVPTDEYDIEMLSRLDIKLTCCPHCGKSPYDSIDKYTALGAVVDVLSEVPTKDTEK
jgi:hypothetical protein